MAVVILDWEFERGSLAKSKAPWKVIFVKCVDVEFGDDLSADSEALYIYNSASSTWEVHPTNTSAMHYILWCPILHSL